MHPLPYKSQNKTQKEITYCRMTYFESMDGMAHMGFSQKWEQNVDVKGFSRDEEVVCLFILSLLIFSSSQSRPCPAPFHYHISHTHSGVSYHALSLQDMVHQLCTSALAKGPQHNTTAWLLGLKMCKHNIAAEFEDKRSFQKDIKGLDGLFRVINEWHRRPWSGGRRGGDRDGDRRPMYRPSHYGATTTPS